MTVAFVQS